MKFSIVVANYNNGKYLPKLIDTVLAQTYQDWELVIVDDCSTDDSQEVLKSFAKHPQIKIYHHEVNQGASGAFKTATLKAEGEIIGMLGADDGLPPNALEEVTRAYQENPEVVSLYTLAYDCKFDDLSVIEVYTGSRGPSENATALLDNPLKNYNFQTFKKSAYLQTSGFDTNLKVAVDQDIFLKIEETGKVMCLAKPLYYYRQNMNGISRVSVKKSMMNQKRVMLNTYYRRKSSNARNNISRDLYLNILRAYHHEKSEFIRSKSPLQSIWLILRTLYYLPGDIKQKQYWKTLWQALRMKQSN
ncbi:MAG TPA: hypothetical protein DCS93_44305 [Microscillaceae bacterium]|nr:hypothetical protein [Microscillaceae bacterium]